MPPLPKIKRRPGASQDSSSIGNEKIKIVFDVPMLNALIKYMQCEFVPNMHKANLNKLIKTIDIEAYQTMPDQYSRLKLIDGLCTAMVVDNLTDMDLIESQLRKDLEVSDYLNTSPLKKNQLTSSDCKAIGISVNERLQLALVYKQKDEILDLMQRLDRVGFTSVDEIVRELKQKLGRLMVDLQGASANVGVMRSFNFTGDQFFDLLNLIVSKAKKPQSVLYSGMRQLNALLSPGFRGGRLYTFLGGSGKFKSGTLLNLADQLRYANPHIKGFENGMRKTILFVTAENTIEESIERLFDMYADDEDQIQNLGTEDVLRILQEKGKFIFTDEEGIDIDFRYYSNLEISTAQLYTLIQELADQGREVICLILDYIKRIDCVHYCNGDERLRLSFAAKELKSLAQFFEIPVITAMQINRDANATIDAAMRDNREDVLKFIGPSAIGNCWDIIEESDWVGLINLCMQKSTGKAYLSIKLGKIRGKKDPFAIDYFNQPFANDKNIRLYPDIFDDSPAAIVSIESDLMSIEDKELKKVSNRPTVSSQRDSKKSKILDGVGSIGAISLDSVMQAAKEAGDAA